LQSPHGAIKVEGNEAQADEITNFVSIEVQQFITNVDDLATFANQNASNNH
jgi:hypothetical protein